MEEMEGCSSDKGRKVKIPGLGGGDAMSPTANPYVLPHSALFNGATLSQAVGRSASDAWYVGSVMLLDRY
jgi:hypothetical protein